jgi:two-component system phosphate regulon response regulator PhoB
MMAAILFVDDESAIRDMLRMVLKLSGHVPMEAADAEHARKIVQEQKPDLALVDMAHYSFVMFARRLTHCPNGPAPQSNL